MSIQSLQKTDTSISKITFSSYDITTFIQNLDSNKAHDLNKISIRMLKLIGKSMSKSLALIFHSYVKHREFPIG